MSANKTTSTYWKTRLKTLPTKCNDDVQTATLYIRIQLGGKREYLPVGTLDKTIGAERAKEIYLPVLAGKTEEAKSKYGVRKLVVKKELIAVGDYLEIVKERGDLLASTYENYVHCLKIILAEILEIPKTKARFSYRNGKSSKWAKQIFETPLAEIVKDKVSSWRSARIKAAGANPLKILSATRTANSYILTIESHTNHPCVYLARLRRKTPCYTKKLANLATGILFYLLNKS
jgi:hypothetical protein